MFDSNRLRTEAEPPNTAHLFVMNIDGSDQTPLVRGSSATWSPDGRRIAFHGSAMNASRSGDILAEAFERYLGWDVHRHES